MKFQQKEVGAHLGFLIADLPHKTSRSMQSIVQYYFGSYTHYKNFCHELYPGRSGKFYEKCALALLDFTEFELWTMNEFRAFPYPAYGDLSNVD